MSLKECKGGRVSLLSLLGSGQEKVLAAPEFGEMITILFITEVKM